MTNEPLDEKEIFNVARQIDAANARIQYLKQVCGEDNSLLERVQTLLSGYGEQASFLESPPAENFSLTLEQSISEGPGNQIGPYKLLQKIGEGGMGVVYMAEQSKPVQRRVALKIIKPGMDTREVIARFEAERQALALMDHPNIAKVLDAGATQTGRPYFIMELVRGVPLVEFCDQNNLSTRERLELFAVVCRAVQHAHQRGVIHRDLKPSNILVTLHDNRPVPKVIDFGVAKAISQKLTEKTMFTAFGQMVGTPVYMSPEQAQMSGLDVDTRSDVYSLGVILYELLTGSTPITVDQLRNSGYAEMQRLIRENEPPKPSIRLSSTAGEAQAKIAKFRGTDIKRLSALLSGDLDWIVMKALDKDRNRRYDSANGFADDVERFLTNDAVVARPPSFSYRLRKTFARHKTAFTTASLLLVTILFGIVATSWQAWVARSEWNRAESALVEVDLERKKAIEEAEKAIEARERAEAEKRRADQLRHNSDVANYASRIRLADPEYTRVGDSEALAILDDTDPKLRGWEHARLKGIWKSRRHLFPAESHFNAIAISPDGDLVAAGGTGATVKLFGFKTNRVIEEFKTGGSEVATLRFSPDGQTLIIGTYTTLFAWDMRTLEPGGQIQLPEQTRLPLKEVLRKAMAEKKQASKPQNNEPEISPLWSNPPRQRPFVAFDGKGTKIAVATTAGIQIWDAKLGEMLSNFPLNTDSGKQSYLVGLDFFPKSNRLAVKQRVYRNGQKRPPNDEYFILNSETNEREATSGETENYVMSHYDGSLLVHPTGRMLVTDGVGFLTRALTMLDVDTFQQTSQLATGESYADAFRLSGNGLRFAVSSGSNVSIRNFGSGALISTLSPPFRVAGGMGNVIDMAISDDGNRVVACFGRPARAELESLPKQEFPEGVVGWDLGDDAAIQSFKDSLPTRFGRDESIGVRMFVAPSEGDWFAHSLKSSNQMSEKSMSNDKEAIDDSSSSVNPMSTTSIVFRSCEDGSMLFQLAESTTGGMRIPSISKDGRIMAVRNGDETLELWDVAGRQQLSVPPHGYKHIDNALVDPTGRLLLIQGRNENVTEQVIWNLESGQPVEPTRIRYTADTEGTRIVARCLAFDHAGERIARFFAEEIRPEKPGSKIRLLNARLEIVDASTGRVIHKLKESVGSVMQAVVLDQGNSICFVTKGDAGKGEGTWYWESTQKQPTRIHDRGGHSLQVSRDGDRILLCELDRKQLYKSTLTLFDAGTRKIVYQEELKKMSELLMTGTGDILQFPMLEPGRRLIRQTPKSNP